MVAGIDENYVDPCISISLNKNQLINIAPGRKEPHKNKISPEKTRTWRPYVGPPRGINIANIEDHVMKNIKTIAFASIIGVAALSATSAQAFWGWDNGNGNGWGNGYNNGNGSGNGYGNGNGGGDGSFGFSMSGNGRGNGSGNGNGSNGWNGNNTYNGYNGYNNGYAPYGYAPYGYAPQAYGAPNGQQARPTAPAQQYAPAPGYAPYPPYGPYGPQAYRAPTQAPAAPAAGQ